MFKLLNNHVHADITVKLKPRCNTGRGRKDFEAKNRVIARVFHDETSKCPEVKLFLGF